MIFKTKAKSSSSGETIALADIVMNLFVFFFITFGLNTSFDAAKKGVFPIDLPKASRAATQPTDKPLTLSIHRSGKISLGPKMIEAGQLKSALNRELSLRRDKNILIQADKSIALETFVSILDIVKTTEARSVAIETKF